MGVAGSYRPGMDNIMTADLELTPPDVEHQTRGTRHVRWFIPAAAVAVVAAAALVGAAITASGNGSAQQPNLPASQVSTAMPSTATSNTPAPSTTAPAPRPSAATPTTRPSQPAPVLLRSGAQQGRAQIPWSQVGPGWYLAAPHSATLSAGNALYLVNPIGGRYLITDHLPHATDDVAGWSPDGTRAMLARQENNHRILSELELATGRVLHTFDIGDTAFVSYTRPQGRAILVTRFDGKNELLQRLGTDGRHQLTYPTTLPGFGKVGFPLLYNADGTELLVGGDHGIALLGNDGRLIRELPAPAGAWHCWPAKWWNSSTVQETCDSQESTRYSVLLQPVAGGQPEELAGASETYPLGFADAWRYSEGTLLSEGTGCGPGRLDLMHDGIIRRLRLPAGVQDSPPVIGMAGDVVALRQLGGCPSRHEESVISFNLVTGATSTLFHGNAWLIPYPWRQP